MIVAVNSNPAPGALEPPDLLGAGEEIVAPGDQDVRL